MEVICCYCKSNFCKKQPHEDKRECSGICDACFDEMIKRHKLKRAEADSKLIRK